MTRNGNRQRIPLVTVKGPQAFRRSSACIIEGIKDGKHHDSFNHLSDSSVIYYNFIIMTKPLTPRRLAGIYSLSPVSNFSVCVRLSHMDEDNLNTAFIESIQGQIINGPFDHSGIS